MKLLMEPTTPTTPDEKLLMDESARLHAEAWRARQRADAQARAAADFDRQHGLMPPCHLCGRRKCGH